MTTRDAEGGNPVIIAPTGLEFQIKTQNYTFQLLLCQKKVI